MRIPGSSTVRTFRSPEEFAPHLRWLMEDRPLHPSGKSACGCKYCSEREQKKITPEYFPQEAEPQVRRTLGRGVLGGGVRPKARPPARREPERPIVAKDYTKLPPNKIAK